MPADPLSVIYADDALVVLDKPSGLLSVPGRGVDKQDCLSARAQRRFPDASVVHRLDMGTSGLMLMARGKSALQNLNRAFAERQVHKTYVAVVHGQPAQPSEHWGLIDLAIGIDWPNRPRRVVDPAHGKPSRTRYRVLAGAGTRYARVELEPLTGRSHQLRVHMMAIGHPIVGDPLYPATADACQAGRLLLHATQIRFLHPMTERPMAFASSAAF